VVENKPRETQSTRTSALPTCFQAQRLEVHFENPSPVAIKTSMRRMPSRAVCLFGIFICVCTITGAQAVSQADKSEVTRTKPDGMESRKQEEGRLKWAFIKIPAGEFDMGCSPDNGECDGANANERPRHHVRISKGFEIGKYEVTQAMWESVMGSNPSHFEGADRPVDKVGWEDTQKFLRRLNARNDGYRYRLPTEAEWEYAARAGSTTAHYGSLDRIAWYRGNSNRQTHPVGQKQPNAWGLYDVEGNVWEWVQDFYIEKYYSISPLVDPQGPALGLGRVIRGGSFRDGGRTLRVSDRWFRSHAGTKEIGFRCVREAR
jgi:formylglycine-generating enzyme required for sulfatase activity